MKATDVCKAVLGLKHKSNIPYRNYQRLVADTVQGTGANNQCLYSMISNTCNMHSISIFILHNHWKSQEFSSLPLQGILQCFYSPKHLFRFPVNTSSPGSQNQECFWSSTKERTERPQQVYN